METIDKIGVSLKLQSKLVQLSSLIGNTPLYDFSSFTKQDDVKLFAKLEWMQMGESVKARPAFNIIKQAIEIGALDESITLLDATSGNTGIAYASICRSLGINISLCLPENASPERKTILKALGVDIIYTSRFEGTDGAQDEALALSLKYPDKYFYASQYTRDANWRAHYLHTSAEIWNQTDGEVTHFVSGLGTTGTLVGTSRGLKDRNAEIKVIGLQPNNPMHGLEGWKHLETAKMPLIYDKNAHDELREIDTLEAFDMMKEIAAREGLLVGPSGAANLVGALSVANELSSGAVVTSFADSASKYSELINKIFS